ncbi:MAG TPA: serpin family protein, partial [Pyrinomonadaceae bacterium]
MKTFFAVVNALILCSTLASMGRMENHRAIANPQPEKEQSKKVDDWLIAANSGFAFKLYGQVLKQRGGENVFISPASIMLALAMTYNGAEGETRKAMADALEVDSMSPEEVNRAFADLRSTLANADPKLQLRIANSLWAKNSFTPKPTFIQRSKEYYA